ncbi:TetR/AcrR family transcriptional regulator [Arthrobacter sp. SAFR-044]|uniref:TetR/AcrR family transcriptional regulator n=1 Tax=Arthrobacter sp. SAFR-044 TaxID=3387278 RepID=UPI003F7BB66A
MNSPVRRTRNGAARHDAIVRAAGQLFAQKGYWSISLRQVAREAGISMQGLLRYFPSKEDLLTAVLDGLRERRAEGGPVMADTMVSLDVFAELAERNQQLEGYSEVYSVLLGEASNPDHPAHLRFVERARRVQDVITNHFLSAVERGELPQDIDVVGEARRFQAAWDGLQLHSLYSPDVNVPAMLRRRLEQMAGRIPRGFGSSLPNIAPAAPPRVRELDKDGYSAGRQTRDCLLRAAVDLFSGEGYHNTSLADISRRAGIAKSTVFHHFATKEHLLIAVINRWRRSLDDARDSELETDSFWDHLVKTATYELSSASMLRLSVVLASEARPADHPAHDYVDERLQRSRSDFALAAGGLGLSDPATEGVWLAALLDGLRIGWLYDPMSVDVASDMEAHLGSLAKTALRDSGS